MEFKYKVTPHTSGREREVTIEFTPYTNLIGEKSNSLDMWEHPANIRLEMDKYHPIFPETVGSVMLKATEIGTETYIVSYVPTEIGKTYLFTMYVRNNDARSSSLYIQGQYKDSVLDPFTQRIAGTFTADSEETEIKLELYDYNVQPPERSQIVWVGGEMLVEIQEEESIERLKRKYEYVENEKESPTVKDLLDKLLHFSPYRYYLVANGRRLENHATQLSKVGIDENTSLQTGIAQIPEQIFNAFTADIPLMAMLEGKRDHVSHAFPKEDREMSRLHTSHFPRIQFFTGFAVNKRISDVSPDVEEMNFAFNLYIPVTKVMESVSATMLLDQSSAILAELGWAKVRGSDYFLKNEQLYVIQSQYIQDQPKPNKRN